MVAELGGTRRIIEGKKVIDPFAWLEWPADEVFAWVRDQESRTSAALTSLPGDQAELSGRIRQALSYEMRTVPLGRSAGYLFLCSPPNAERASLWLSSSPGEAGHEILHPACLDQADGMAEIGSLWPSPNGLHAVLAVTHGGRQCTQLVVIAIDADESAAILERLDTPSFAWASWHDDRAFFWSHRVDDAQVLALKDLDGGNAHVEAPCGASAGGMVPIVSDDGAWLVLLTYAPGVPGCQLFAATNAPSPTFVEIGGFASEDLVLAGWRPDGLTLASTFGA